VCNCITAPCDCDTTSTAVDACLAGKASSWACTNLGLGCKFYDGHNAPTDGHGESCTKDWCSSICVANGPTPAPVAEVIAPVDVDPCLAGKASKWACTHPDSDKVRSSFLWLLGLFLFFTIYFSLLCSSILF
jgi:hypothetical protein